MEERSLIERLARHLAADRPDQWAARADDAATILAILKDPDPAMREVGDGSAWRAMIDAALRQRWQVTSAPASDQPEGGADEEGEMPLPEHAATHDRASWVHLHPDKPSSIR
jgi:hypothetical protein